MCRWCGHDNAARAEFCASCGSDLTKGASAAPGEARSPSSPPASTPVPPSAERRQLTVTFCDLVGSTALAARTDPEEGREVICAYQNAAAAEITRFADGVLAYFGWPRAPEDDAERAVHAGLAVVDRVIRAPDKSLSMMAAPKGASAPHSRDAPGSTCPFADGSRLSASRASNLLSASSPASSRIG